MANKKEMKGLKMGQIICEKRDKPGDLGGRGGNKGVRA